MPPSICLLATSHSNIPFPSHDLASFDPLSLILQPSSSFLFTPLARCFPPIRPTHPLLCILHYPKCSAFFTYSLHPASIPPSSILLHPSSTHPSPLALHSRNRPRRHRPLLRHRHRLQSRRRRRCVLRRRRGQHPGRRDEAGHRDGCLRRLPLGQRTCVLPLVHHPTPRSLLFPPTPRTPFTVFLIKPHKHART